MINEKIKALLDERLKEEDLNDCFVTEVKQNNTKLEVYVDSADAMSYDKCTKISRFLESHLDENKWLGEKYILEVSSPGATKPLVDKRQYKKHLGRKVEIATKEEEKFKGVFESFDDEKITISYTETTKQGKKKIKTDVVKDIPLSDIEEFKIKISF